MIESFFEESGDQNVGGRQLADGTFRRGVVMDTWVLQSIIGTYDLDNDPYFSNGRPFEYFAALALCHAIEGTRDLSPRHEPSATDPSVAGLSAELPSEAMKAALDDPSFKWIGAGRHAVEAMAAITWAEALAERECEIETRINDLAEHKAKKKISEAASRAAQKRHARNRDLKELAHTFFDEHRHEYSGLDNLASALSITMTEVGWRTIRDWFTDFNRSGPSRARRG